MANNVNSLVSETKKVKEPLFHISRKTNTSLKTKIIIKVGVILGLFLIFGLVTTLIAKDFTKFGSFFETLILKTFRNANSFRSTLYDFALLFGASICIYPAFKMKYWNLGVAGQVLIGAIGAFAVLNYGANVIPDVILVILMLLAALVCSVIWAVIPAIFKAYFNTNESLFTLMMNYIAIVLVTLFVKLWHNNVSGSIDPIEFGFGNWVTSNRYSLYTIITIAILIIAVIVSIYIKKSKHGYEISVIGGSKNTARYIGINVKKVIIRTLALSGLIAGFIAFAIVLVNRSLSTQFADTGYGFTGILTLWCGGGNPILTGLFSYLYVFSNNGLASVAGNLHISSYISQIYLSILFLFLIGCEFFLNYNVVFRKKNVEEKTETSNEVVVEKEPASSEETPKADDKKIKKTTSKKTTKKTNSLKTNKKGGK